MDRWINPHRRDVEYDALRRQLPRRVDFNLILRAIGACRDEHGQCFADRIRAVPALAVAESGSDDDGAYALVSCPCGAKRVVRASPVKCSGCERYFVLSASGAAFVLYGDMDVPRATALE